MLKPLWRSLSPEFNDSGSRFNKPALVDLGAPGKFLGDRSMRSTEGITQSNPCLQFYTSWGNSI